MALEKKNVGFPFARGVNTKTSEMTQPVEDLRLAENVSITKTGELNPRNGFHEEDWAELGGAAQPGELFGAAHHQDELVVFDGEKAYSRYTSGKFKDRGTCANVQIRQESVNVDSTSLDGAPAYSTIKVGSDNDLYEIFVWESRPFGEDDVRGDTKSYANTDDTINYRNKPSRLLYSIKHKASGVLLYDAVPISVPFASGISKSFVDRDLLIGGASGLGVYHHASDDAGRIRIEGYGSTAAITGREWADVVADGNQLILDGPFDTGTAGSAKAPMFFTDDEFAVEAVGYVQVGKLSDSDIDNTAKVHPTGTSAMANVDIYLNVETGQNAMYFTTQPMLFSMSDNVVILTFAAQSAAVKDKDGGTGEVGMWSIFQATFDFSSAVSAIGAATPISNFEDGYLDLNYKYPAWDADLTYTIEDDHGVVYVYYTNDSTNTTKLQYYKYDSSTKALVTSPTVTSNIPRANGSDPSQLIQIANMGSAKDQFGGNNPDNWLRYAVPSRFVLKCINHTDAGNLENHASNKIVFVFSSDATKDDDIYVYTAPALSDGSIASWTASLIKPLLDRATSSSTWNIPDDLAVYRDETGAVAGQMVTYDSAANKFSCGGANGLRVANAAITNVKSVSGDAVYVFVECALANGAGGAVWYTQAASAVGSNAYIGSEQRWIIRKNLANSSDTKVLGRNINILSDAWYPYSGSKAYFVGHSVFAADPSTARTCLFNEDGEVVGTYAPGQAVLCHPYEMRQMSIPVTKYSNAPMFSLRSRLNYHRTDSILQPYKYSNPPSLAEYPMPAFGISVIEHAERSYQYMAPFNPRIGIADFFPARTYPNANINGTLLVGSGLLWAFNGGRFVENGFLQKPLIKYVSQDASDFANGTASVAGITKGDYEIAAAYFWKDDMGVTHYSGLDFFGDGSTNRTVTVSDSGKKLLVQIENTSLTNKRSAAHQSIGYSGTAPEITDIADMEPSSVSVAVFMSVILSETIEDTQELANIRFRLVAMQPLNSNARNVVVEVDTPNKVTQWKDHATGVSDLVSNFPVQPSCPTDITIHKNHVCVSTVDGYVYPSQSFSSSLGTQGSSVCPVFSAVNTVNIGEETNGVGASNIESDGQLLMAFNKDAVYAMGGDGPDHLNVGGFAPPETIYLDQGVMVGGVTARIPAGVVYQSTHGLYLLNGKNLSYLGAPLDGEWGASTYMGNISGVSVLDETNEVVFVTGSSGSWAKDPNSYLPSLGMSIIIYNYEVNQWYTWKVPVDTTGQKFSGCSYVKRSDGKRDLFLTDNKGGVWLRATIDSSSSSAYRYADYSQSKDGGPGYYRVQMNVKTGKIQFPQFLSGCRLYRLAVPFTTASYGEFSISYASELGTYSSSQTLSYTQSSSSEREVVIKPQQQKVDRFHVDIVCRGTTDVSQPPALNGLGLLIAPRQAKAVYNVEKTQVAT
jgi:hypothetical protein